MIDQVCSFYFELSTGSVSCFTDRRVIFFANNDIPQMQPRRIGLHRCHTHVISGIGTFETSRNVRFSVAVGGKSDISPTTHFGSEDIANAFGASRPITIKAEQSSQATLSACEPRCPTTMPWCRFGLISRPSSEIYSKCYPILGPSPS